MNGAVAETLRTLGRALMQLGDDLALTTSPAQTPKFYTSTNLPAGAKSWRSVRATAYRLGVPVAKVGRDAVIDAAAFDAAIEARATKRFETKPSADEQEIAELRAMGLEVAR